MTGGDVKTAVFCLFCWGAEIFRGSHIKCVCVFFNQVRAEVPISNVHGKLSLVFLFFVVFFLNGTVVR